MNITKFRKDISKHFNDAVQGRPVYIQRAGQMFKLEAFKTTSTGPLESNSIDLETGVATNMRTGVKKKLERVPSPRVTPEELVDIFSKAPQINLTTADKIKTNGLCKKCGGILASYGKCLNKTCK